MARIPGFPLAASEVALRWQAFSLVIWSYKKAVAFSVRPEEGRTKSSFRLANYLSACRSIVYVRGECRTRWCDCFDVVSFG